jgi:hypothetical protein
MADGAATTITPVKKDHFNKYQAGHPEQQRAQQ